MRPSKPMSRQVIPILLCILATLLTACGGQTSTPPPSNAGSDKASDDKQVFVRPITGRADLKTFDPALAGDLNSINAINMVFSGLVTLNDKLEVQKQLAQSYEVSQDGLNWTFRLKPGLKFSDGQPLTSKDVAYSIDRALDPKVQSAVSTTYLGLLKDADKRNTGKVSSLINDSIITPDDQTIILKTSQKAAYFLEALTYNTSFVVERKLIDKYGANFTDHLNEGGTSGPWKVDKFEHGKQIVLVPNPYYSGNKPKLKKVVIPFFKNSQTAYQEYQNGQLHSTGVPSSMLTAARGLPDNQFHQTPILAIDFIAMNYLTKPFDNLKIRQAFALALNKDALAHNVNKDTTIATNHIVPKGMPGYNQNLTGPQNVKETKGDATMAKKLLDEGMKEAGYTAANFPTVTFTVATEGSADAANAFSAMQQMWKNALGINVKIRDTEFGTLLDEANAAANNPKGIQMWYADWYADYPDPQDWLTLLFGSNASKNGMNYGQNKQPYNSAQQANQALMLKADANTNDTERMQQYNQIEQALVNDVAWIPTAQETSTSVRKTCIVGMVDNAQGLTPPDDWGSIYISTNANCADASKYK
ncbi:peptide ABC transporter substrate-binding protein [Dictyobacter alpinus]|uniref:Peptide ABC transporter substrate-binding protein n=1 Tax=Dictyobacter alpinus TaxID=2014873 RepID=A0A402BHJ4_9CHLR|nr:peptide ABC transporter substrate-binding protein [Dictyobacter alpinus]GCE30712.1 peptide ABC transporter substrate-binding protein [Dictyobacter alpinus]